jgi:hypothetical protein
MRDVVAQSHTPHRGQTAAQALGRARFGQQNQCRSMPQNDQNALERINQTNPPELEVKGRMVINGVDLEERLKTIETVLQIPERDVILEKKHPKLKKLYDEYIAALGKYRTFESIKGDE